jgi:hypothetical protein
MRLDAILAFDESIIKVLLSKYQRGQRRVRKIIFEFRTYDIYL